MKVGKGPERLDLMVARVRVRISALIPCKLKKGEIRVKQSELTHYIC